MKTLYCRFDIFFFFFGVKFHCRFGHVYNNLQTRLTKTLLNAFLDPKRSLTQQYGAIQGLAALGPNVVFSTPMLLVIEDENKSYFLLNACLKVIHRLLSVLYLLEPNLTD